MKYTIKADTMENADGMREFLYCYEVEAMSAIDAVIKASLKAGDDEEFIKCEDGEFEINAYRNNDGSYEFHVYNENADMAFTI